MLIMSKRKFGAGNETRTRDPDLGKVVLYQLSYSRKVITTILPITYGLRIIRKIVKQTSTFSHKKSIFNLNAA